MRLFVLTALALLATALPGFCEGEIRCDIDSGPCTALLEETSTTVTFDIMPKPVKPMSKLVFSVGLKKDDTPLRDDRVVVKLTMPGMFMAENKVPLAFEEVGIHRGTGVIVRCPSGGNTWQATVDAPSAGSVSFIFELDR